MSRLASTEEFRCGIIFGRMQETESIIQELERPVDFTFAELERFRERIDSVDSAIRELRREVSHPQVRIKMRDYEAKSEIAIDYLERREKNAGRPVAESESRRASRLRDSDLDMYASDGKHEVPMQYYSVVQTTSTFQLLNAQDLRLALNQRREGSGLRGFDEPTTSDGQRRPLRGERTAFRDQPQPRSSTSSRTSPISEPMYGGNQHTHTRPTRRHEELSSSSSGVHQRPRLRSPSSASVRYIHTSSSQFSSATKASYQSAPMQRARGPQHGVPLPPIRNELPKPICAGDQSLIGMTEIYIRPASKACPMCGGDHRMFRCKDFKQQILVDRWYHALTLGVCLHCLRHGHSSFKCWVDGCCHLCHMPHNTLLCPKTLGNSTDAS